MKGPSTEIVFGLALAAGWAASLLLPVAIMGNEPDNIFPGYAILMMGWFGFAIGQFGWLLNLLLWPALGMIMSRSSISPKLQMSLSLVMAILIVNALFWDRMNGDMGSAEVVEWGAGYYLWFGVMMLATILLGDTALSAADVANRLTEKDDEEGQSAMQNG